MDTASVTATAEVTVLMTPAEKSSLERKARRAKLSVSEYVRQILDTYDSEEMEQLAEIARAFRESAERASAAVDRANANIEMTRSRLSRRDRP